MAHCRRNHVLHVWGFITAWLTNRTTLLKSCDAIQKSEPRRLSMAAPLYFKQLCILIAPLSLCVAVREGMNEWINDRMEEGRSHLRESSSPEFPITSLQYGRPHVDETVCSNLDGNRTCCHKMRHGDEQMLGRACIVRRGTGTQPSVPSMYKSFLHCMISKTVRILFKLYKINIQAPWSSSIPTSTLSSHWMWRLSHEAHSPGLHNL